MHISLQYTYIAHCSCCLILPSPFSYKMKWLACGYTPNFWFESVVVQCWASSLFFVCLFCFVFVKAFSVFHSVSHCSLTCVLFRKWSKLYCHISFNGFGCMCTYRNGVGVRDKLHLWRQEPSVRHSRRCLLTILWDRTWQSSAVNQSLPGPRRYREFSPT